MPRHIDWMDHTSIDGEIVCPHCGYSYEDADFCADQHYEGGMECEECGGEFLFRAEFEITWTTTKVKK